MTQLAQLEVTREPDALVARIVGEIDISNAGELGTVLENAVPSGALGLVLDLSGTSYIDSAGIHFLFRLGARLTTRRQQLRLVLPDDAPIKKVVKLAGVSWTVPHDASVPEALARLRAEVHPSRGEDAWVSDPEYFPFF